VVALVAVAAALTVSVFASTTTGASAEPEGCHTGTKVCPVVHEEGCTLLVIVDAVAATPRPYCVMPESPVLPLGVMQVPLPSPVGTCPLVHPVTVNFAGSVIPAVA